MKFFCFNNFRWRRWQRWSVRFHTWSQTPGQSAICLCPWCLKSISMAILDTRRIRTWSVSIITTPRSDILLNRAILDRTAYTCPNHIRLTVPTAHRNIVELLRRMVRTRCCSFHFSQNEKWTILFIHRLFHSRHLIGLKMDSTNTYLHNVQTPNMQI